MKRGELYALANNEIRFIAAFLYSASNLFSTPACVIAIQVLVFVQLKHYGFVVSICFLAGTAVLLYIAYLMYERHWIKTVLHGERMGCNL